MKSLERIGVFSLAKIQGLIGLVLGLLYGILLFILENTVPESVNELNKLGPSLMLLIPLIGLIYGFIAGIVIAFLYNIFTKMVGGLRLEFKER